MLIHIERQLKGREPILTFLPEVFIEFMSENCFKLLRGYQTKFLPQFSAITRDQEVGCKSMKMLTALDDLKIKKMGVNFYYLMYENLTVTSKKRCGWAAEETQ